MTHVIQYSYDKNTICLVIKIQYHTMFSTYCIPNNYNFDSCFATIFVLYYMQCYLYQDAILLFRMYNLVAIKVQFLLLLDYNTIVG